MGIKNIPTLKKLINQMENNDKYIIKINKIIQQDEQTKHLLRGLKNDINFETINKEYKLIVKSRIAYDPFLNHYYFTITKNDEELLKGSITPVHKIQKFKITFDYDFEKDLVELNNDIVQLFEDAI